jgi:hypothetical protein
MIELTTKYKRKYYSSPDYKKLTSKQDPISYFDWCQGHLSRMCMWQWQWSRQATLIVRSRSAVLISWLKNTVDWFVVREKYCSDRKKTSWKRRIISQVNKTYHDGFGTDVHVAVTMAPFGWNYKPAEKHCWLIFCERKILFQLKKQTE